MTFKEQKPMTDLVSYYVQTNSSPGPASLFRRRPGQVDERFVSGEKETWRCHSGLKKYEAGRADDDFYAIHPDEAERVIAWYREIRRVGIDKVSRPPLLGEWSVGCAWLVSLKEGPLPEQTVETILSRLGMARRTHGADLGERTVGLRVLRSDMKCRWNFELHRSSSNSWFLSLLFLRLMPDERVIQGLRDEVYPLVEELGLDIVKEQVAIQDSWSNVIDIVKAGPHAGRVRRPTRGDEDEDQDRVLAVWFRGRMTERNLRTLHKRWNLTDEWGADLDEYWKLERGIGYLPNDTRFRAQLRLRRTSDDEDLWRFEIGIEGLRPPEETIDGWREDIVAAATAVDLVYERDWLAPRPMPHDQTPLLPPPVRTSAQVFVRYRAYLDGRFTASTLDGFRDKLGIDKRGRIDDDSKQVFGDRCLRDEKNRLVRLMLGRTFDGDWFLSLSYQDTPPDQATVDQLARDIHAAATQAGLTVSGEWHQPAPEDTA